MKRAFEHACDSLGVPFREEYFAKMVIPEEEILRAKQRQRTEQEMAKAYVKRYRKAQVQDEMVEFRKKVKLQGQQQTAQHRRELEEKLKTNCATFVSDHSKECILCLGPMDLGETNTLPCVHTFHTSCFARLCKRECPICAASIDVPDDVHIVMDDDSPWSV